MRRSVVYAVFAFCAAFVLTQCKPMISGESSQSEWEAQREAELKKLYRIVFDANGGNFTDGSEECIVGQSPGVKIQAPDGNPAEKSGKVLLGWSLERQNDAAYDSSPSFWDVRDSDFTIREGDDKFIIKPGKADLDDDCQWVNDVDRGDKIVYAVWKAASPGTFDIKFSYWNETDADFVVRAVRGGDRIQVSEIPTPVRAHHTRDGTGWFYTGVGGYPEEFDFSTQAITENMRVYAKWDETGYVVYYDFGTNGSISGQKIDNRYGVKWGESNLLPAGKPTQTGYEFAGWSASSPSGKRTPGVTDASTYGSMANDVDAHITISAVWVAENCYAVSYASDGLVTGLPRDMSDVEWTQKGLVPVDKPQRAGYEFDGWKCGGKDVYIDSTYGELSYSYNGSNNSKSIVIQAQWKVKYYTVLLKGDGISEYRYSVSYEESVLEKAPQQGKIKPTRAGWTFSQWEYKSKIVAASALFKDLVPDGDLNGNLEINAVWIQKTFTVIYNLDGGTYSNFDALNPETNIHWDDYNLLPGREHYASNALQKAGYKFDGWKTNNADVSKNNNIDGNDQYKALVENDDVRSVTLLAKWAEKTNYVVNYDLDGGRSDFSVNQRVNVHWMEAWLLPGSGSYNSSKFTNGALVLDKWIVVENPSAPVPITKDSKYGDLAGGEMTSITLKAVWRDADKPVLRVDSSTIDLGSIAEGYGSVDGALSQSITVYNGGSVESGLLSVGYHSGTYNYLRFSDVSINSIGAGSSGSFSVTPIHGLATDSYSETIVITASGVSTTVTVNFTVKEYIEDRAELLKFIQTHSNGTRDNPLRLAPVKVGSSDKLKDLSIGILRYVEIDLSKCTNIKSGGDFTWGQDMLNNPGNIVSLTLPETITAIYSAGTEATGAFKDYTNLKTVTGGGVMAIGKYAFAGVDGLEDANFPGNHLSISQGAFYNKNELILYAPKAVVIDNAFNNQTNLIGIILGDGCDVRGTDKNGFKTAYDSGTGDHVSKEGGTYSYGNTWTFIISDRSTDPETIIKDLTWNKGTRGWETTPTKAAASPAGITIFQRLRDLLRP